MTTTAAISPPAGPLRRAATRLVRLLLGAAALIALSLALQALVRIVVRTRRGDVAISGRRRRVNEHETEGSCHEPIHQSADQIE